VSGNARHSNVPALQWETSNRANIFTTTGLADAHPDADLRTPNWNNSTPSLGNVLVVQELVAPNNLASDPNDNAHGSIMVLDFSAVGPVTVSSMNVLDVEKLTKLRSRVDFYDRTNNKINATDIMIAPTGNNGVGTVHFSKMKGVMKMVVTFDDAWNASTNAGSGAIDNIAFSRMPERCDLIDFEFSESFPRDANGFITGILSLKGAAIMVSGSARHSNVPASKWESGNRANIFTTTGLPKNHPDADLKTPNWNNSTPYLRNVLVVQELVVPYNLAADPNDNAHGGRLVLDFSAAGPVTVNSMNVLDIEKYKESRSRVDFYDGANNKINATDIMIAPTGDNGVGTVYFSDMEGVVKMVVTFDGSWNASTNAGGGAIDNIEFCKATLQ
jgi:hypothetical protein